MAKILGWSWQFSAVMMTEVGLAGSDKISDNLQPIECDGLIMGPGKFRSVMNW
jgi:hypothetical protein